MNAEHHNLYGFKFSESCKKVLDYIVRCHDILSRAIPMEILGDCFVGTDLGVMVFSSL